MWSDHGGAALDSMLGPAARPAPWRRALCVGALWACWLSPAQTAPAFAQELPPVRMARLVKQLGAESFAAREEAGDAILELGFAAREPLELAARSDDPEVRRRAGQLLRKLKLQELWLPGYVQVNAAGESAGKTFAKIAEQTGNRVLLGDEYGAFKEGKVTAFYPRGAFWPVVDDLCRQTGNHFRPNYDHRHPGLVVVAGGPGDNPVAYSGPVRSRIVSAKRDFKEEFNYDRGESESHHTFEMSLEMIWEDRFRLVAYRADPEVVEATTDTGKKLTASQAASSGWKVATPSSRQLAMRLHLHPPPIACRKLSRLALRWSLVAVGDLASLEITSVEAGKSVRQDDIEATVEQLEMGRGGRCELTALILRDLVVPEPHEILFQENRLEVFDAAGKPFRVQGNTQSLTDRGVRCKLILHGETEESVPRVLRVTYPRVRGSHDLPIVFENVPLPTSRPE